VRAQQYIRWSLLGTTILAATVLAAPTALKGKGARLPLPGLKVPENPVIAPTVITARGQRLLLGHTDVKIRYQPTNGLTGARALVVNRPGWWVINFPLTRINGFARESPEQIAMALFGRRAADIRNWYVRTPGPAAPEPKPPNGPAPIELTPNPTITVDQLSPAADDGNPGTRAAPLKTISAAVAKATAGDVVHVYPGLYREAFTIAQNGTRERPTVIEGVRDERGRMPIISGNDPFPANSFRPVKGLKGVWRADIFTNLAGIVSADGRALVERSLPQELRPGEVCFNRGSDEFLHLRFRGDIVPQGGAWKLVKADKDGFFDFGAAYGEKAKSSVFWASTWVWLPPSKSRGQQWDPRFPEPITRRVVTDGRWRAFRMTGSSLSAQVNKYRVWANGKLLPSCIRSQPFDDSEYRNNPRFTRLYGFSGRIDGFPFREGWNHLVFQFDTSHRPKDALKFRFNKPDRTKDEYVVSAVKPTDMAKPAGSSAPYITELMVAGPFPGKADRGVYVRLEGDADPNRVTMDLAARSSQAVRIEGEYVRFRGFTIRHGAHFQQRGMVKVCGQGSTVEGCQLIDSEFGGIGFTTFLTDKDRQIIRAMDQTSDPLTIRNNWIINPGNVGISGSSTTDLLTEDNQNTTAPGRGRILVEHNTIINPNWAGIAPFWASGGMKIFKLTGAVVRYNTVIGGTGPGIWQDWEHYGNRLEGNLSKTGWAMLHGVEASPGPHIICNNLSVDLRPGEVWFRWALLSWSSGRNWCVNNTIDGRWNPTPAWQNKTGGDGINVGTGGDDRKTTWGALPERTNVHLNNLIVGCTRAISHRADDVNARNVTDRGTGADHSDRVGFEDPGNDCYRLRPDSPLNALGVKDNPYTDPVRHDFYGLLRFDEDGRTVGAFRAEREPAPPGAMVEIETTDGKPLRLYEPKPLLRRFSHNIFQADKVYELPAVGKQWAGSSGFETDDGAVWTLRTLPCTQAFSPLVGASKEAWGPSAEYNTEKNGFSDNGAHLTWDERRAAANFGVHGPNRPILIFRAPADGQYLAYAHPGRVSIWGGHSKLMLNLLHFPKGQARGRSLYTFATDAKHKRAPVINQLVTLRAGDELALVCHSDGRSSSSGAILSAYRFKVGYFRK